MAVCVLSKSAIRNDMEWISIKDRMPECGDIVVAWLSKKREPSCVRFDIDSQGPVYYDLVPVDRFMDREDIVTHWTPLPEPPK